MKRFTTRAAKRVAAELHAAADWLETAGDGRIEIGPVIIMGRSKVSAHFRHAFDMGVEAGARGVRPTPTPPEPRKLRSV